MTITEHPNAFNRFPLPRIKVGDIVRCIPKHGDVDPGTVIRILQLNANGPNLVEIRWFKWRTAGGIDTSQEYRNELEIISRAE